MSEMASAMANGSYGADMGTNFGSGYGLKPGSQVSFGPGAPAQPLPVGGDPRRYSYRPAWNIPSLPGEGRMLSYEVIRTFSKMDWLIRKAIEVRKDQMAQIEWDVISRNRTDASKSRKITLSHKKDIDDIKRWMERPDGRNTWDAWIRRIMEDHLAIDGVALFVRRNMDPDAGPTDIVTQNPMGKMMWLEQLDATTIKPLLDTSGRTPLPPLKAYEQYIYGYPRFQFNSQELMWAVRSQNVQSPYGFSPVEQFINLVNLNLRFWLGASAIYTDGTLPEGILTAPEGWTPQLIKGFQDEWNSALAGDPRALRKLQVGPYGLGWISFKEDTFDKDLANMLIMLLIMAFDLSPQDLGWPPGGPGGSASGSRGLGGKGFAESQERQTENREASTIKFIKNNILDPILWNEFGLHDLEFMPINQDDINNPDEAQADDVDLKNGRVSLDELIERDGGSPIGAKRVMLLGNYVLGEPDIIKLSTEGAGSLGLLPQPAAAGPGGPGMPPGGPQGGQEAPEAQDMGEDTGEPAQGAGMPPQVAGEAAENPEAWENGETQIPSAGPGQKIAKAVAGNAGQVAWETAYQHEARGPHGRWISSGVTDSIADSLKSGGFTVHPHTGEIPKHGYQVAQLGRTISHPAEVANDPIRLNRAINGYVKNNQDIFDNPNTKLGGWVHNNRLYLEPSDTIADHDEAIEAGKNRDQVSIWDNEKGQEIQTGGTGEHMTHADQDSGKKPDAKASIIRKALMTSFAGLLAVSAMVSTSTGAQTNTNDYMLNATAQQEEATQLVQEAVRERNNWLHAKGLTIAGGPPDYTTYTKSAAWEDEPRDADGRWVAVDDVDQVHPGDRVRIDSISFPDLHGREARVEGQTALGGMIDVDLPGEGNRSFYPDELRVFKPNVSKAATNAGEIAWENAWRHEPRGAHGRWVSDGGDSPISDLSTDDYDPTEPNHKALARAAFEWTANNSRMRQYLHDAYLKAWGDDPYKAHGRVPNYMPRPGFDNQLLTTESLSKRNAKSLVEAVRVVRPTDKTLYRGLNGSWSPAEVEKMFKVGNEIDLSLASWSSDKRVADDFSHIGFIKETEPTHIEFVLEGQKKAINLQPLADMADNDWLFSNEIVDGHAFTYERPNTGEAIPVNEWATDGKFQVTNLSTDGDTYMVSLQQQAVFRAPQMVGLKSAQIGELPWESAKFDPSIERALDDDPCFARKNPKAAKNDIGAWQRKSLKAVRAGKDADVSFESESIPQELSAVLHGHLGIVKSADEVRSVFSYLDKASALGPGGWQDKYDAFVEDIQGRVKSYATLLNDGKISPTDWYQMMSNTLRSAYTSAYRMGAAVQNGKRGTMDETDLVTIGNYISDELDYLSQFRDQILNEEASPAQISNRVTMYADSVHSLYWMGRKSAIMGQRGAAGEPKYLIDYLAEDDTNTCDPCRLAEDGSPYDPIDAPVPGADICKGKTRCRCMWYVYPNPDYTPLQVLTLAADSDLKKENAGEIAWENAYRHEARGAHGKWVSSGNSLDTSNLSGGQDPDDISSGDAVKRVTALYDRNPTATTDAQWYDKQHDLIGEWADREGIDPQLFASMVAATSADAAWDLPHSPRLPNLELAAAVAKAAKENPDLTPAEMTLMVRPLYSGMVFNTSVNRALRLYRKEDPDKVLNTPKMRSFYDNLVWPGEAGPVTVDRHMVHAIADEHADTDEVKLRMQGLLRGKGPRTAHPEKVKGGYGWLADRIREAAAARGVKPHEMQAGAWAQWRREGGQLKNRKRVVN